MSSSTLEKYLEVLNLLANKGPATSSKIINKINFNCNKLNEYLIFLMGQGLVEKLTGQKDQIIYAITHRGLNVVNYFCDLKQPIAVVQKI